MSKYIAKLLAFFLIASFSSFLVAESDFPGRMVYHDVITIEMDELQKRFDEFLLVDVRSRFEYNTIHIKSALHISVADKQFNDDVKTLYRMTRKPIVFYCNGYTCMKSYQASRAAIAVAGLSNTRVFAFDAGMNAWSKTHPDMTVVLGKNTANTDVLISDATFKEHVIELAEFRAKAEKDSIIIDIRDPFQRKDKSLFPGNDTNVPLDNSSKLRRAIKKAKKSGKLLLVYDAVGRQIRWLQYHLEREGMKEYYFLKGGAAAAK